jgi:hypothetical protein
VRAAFPNRLVLLVRLPLFILIVWSEFKSAFRPDIAWPGPGRKDLEGVIRRLAGCRPKLAGTTHRSDVIEACKVNYRRSEKSVVDGTPKKRFS